MDSGVRGYRMGAIIPFLLLHLGTLAVFWIPFAWKYVVLMIATYFLRMFGVTAGYHRYFSHRSYKMGRIPQFLMAFLAQTSSQKGVLWWAAHHRDHHQNSDLETDIHSPWQSGFWWSHVGWFLCDRFSETDWRLIPDLRKYPELRFLNRYAVIPPALLAATLYGSGAWLKHALPAWHTSGLQMLVWGFCVSTVLLYHATFAVNSLAHCFGRRHFPTSDDSRNSALIALFTFGEGWHNNHHYAPSSERQGFFWWQIDASHYILTLLSWLGLVWDLNRPPQRVYESSSSVTRPQQLVDGRGHL